MRRVMICPSILSADFANLAHDIRVVDKAGADSIHLDIMDGHFVPNISFGPMVVRSIRKITDLPFWAHLMIKEPIKYIKAFREAGVQGIYVHAEVDDDLCSLSDKIHMEGLKSGITINPDTKVGEIANILDRFERVLVMTVYPGFGGQSFIEGALGKISELKQIIKDMPKPPLIEVDGGINQKTAQRVVIAGADGLIVGSAIFGESDPGNALKAIRKEATKD